MVKEDGCSSLLPIQEAQGCRSQEDSLQIYRNPLFLLRSALTFTDGCLS